MSISTEISRIQADRNTIRTKLVELGMATGTDNLSKLATAIEGIVNQGAVSVTVQEGDTYTIPAGYHNGSGTVSGVAGGGNYNLQSKSVTPTKKQQNITPDNGYYGLSDVTVSPIPDNYQDVSSVNAVAGEVVERVVGTVGEREVFAFGDHLFQIFHTGVDSVLASVDDCLFTGELVMTENHQHILRSEILPFLYVMPVISVGMRNERAS